MVFPGLCCYFPVWPTITVLQFHIWLIMNSVQILMKPVQKKSKKLL